MTRGPRPKPTTRHVYVIGPEAGLQKVGLATDPRSRLATLQTASPYDLILHASVPVPFDDAALIERRAHRLLIRSCVRNEWFETTPAEAVAAVQSAAAWARERHQPVKPLSERRTEWRLSSPYRSAWRAPSLDDLPRSGPHAQPAGSLPLFGFRRGADMNVGARYSFGAGAYPTSPRPWEGASRSLGEA